MPGFVSLQSLVEAIAGSVADAQTLVARGQLEGLAGFLDDEGRPRTLDIRLPSLRPGARPGQEDLYSAPLMALVPHTAMRIRQVEVRFAIELGDLDGDSPKPGETRTAVDPATATRRTLSVNPAARPDRAAAGATADVTLVVECLDVPEGLARVLDEVVKTQGYRSSPPPVSDQAVAPPVPMPPTPPTTEVKPAGPAEAATRGGQPPRGTSDATPGPSASPAAEITGRQPPAEPPPKPQKPRT
ncbi:MAG: DUF2589 domain-containing protein [Caulobacter sp.]